MAQELRYERISPKLGEWLAKTVLASDSSIKALMLLDSSGKVLAHRRAVDLEERSPEGEFPIIVPISEQRLVAFVRLDSSAEAEKLYDHVHSLLSYPTDYISR